MSLIDAFLLAANDEIDADFGTSTMVCNGQTFAVVMNDERKSYDGALGGMESDISANATAQPRHVANPRGELVRRLARLIALGQRVFDRVPDQVANVL